MKGWIDLGSAMNWEDYHGTWGKKAPDGAWYVLRWANLLDAGGKEFADTPYVCEVKRLALDEIPEEEIASALQSCGYTVGTDDSGKKAIVEDHDGSIVVTGKGIDLLVVNSCVNYGLGAPLEEFTGRVRPSNIRANARRYAERCMKDAALLKERLARSVNAIGSTAAEVGRGDIDSAMHRGPFDTRKQIMRKMSGMAPVPAVEESTCEFGTLHPDGQVTDIRRIKHADLRRCPFAILIPSHYREDGTCKCDDAEHRKMMIDEWEYTTKDFTGIPLRSEVGGAHG